jgi:hypothetical protein
MSGIAKSNASGADAIPDRTIAHVSESRHPDICLAPRFRPAIWLRDDLPTPYPPRYCKSQRSECPHMGVLNAHWSKDGQIYI